MLTENPPAVGRAHGLVAIGRYADALALLQGSLGSDEAGFEARCLASQCNIELGRLETAVELAEWALVLEPGDDWPHRLIAIAHLRRGRAGRAIALTHATEAARLAPWPLHSLHVLVLAQLANRRVREAADTAAVALERHPLNAVSHLSLALVCQARRDWKGAEKALRAGLAIDPHDPDLSLGLARVLERKGPLRHAAAGEAYVAAARADPASDASRRGVMRLGALPMKWSMWGYGASHSLALANPLKVAGAIGAITLGVAALSVLLRLNATRHLPESVRHGLRREWEIECLAWLGLAGVTSVLIAAWAAGTTPGQGGGPVVAAALAGFGAAALWLARPGIVHALRAPERWLRRRRRAGA